MKILSKMAVLILPMLVLLACEGPTPKPTADAVSERDASVRDTYNLKTASSSYAGCVAPGNRWVNVWSPPGSGVTKRVLLSVPCTIVRAGTQMMIHFAQFDDANIVNEHPVVITVTGEGKPIRNVYGWIASNGSGTVRLSPHMASRCERRELTTRGLWSGQVSICAPGIPGTYTVKARVPGVGTSIAVVEFQVVDTTTPPPTLSDLPDRRVQGRTTTRVFTATATATGGVEPLSYRWSGPHIVTSTGSATQTLTLKAIASGSETLESTYTVVVTDAIGRTDTKTGKLIITRPYS